MSGYHDRRHAGRVLASALAGYGGRRDVLVLALPRGGVPVGYEVAEALGAPLDLMVVRKLGVPGHEELAMGAIASGGARVLNEDVIAALGIPQRIIDAVTRDETIELARREAAWRGEEPPLEVRGKTAILVDDGLATGSTMRAAVAGLRKLGPRRIVIGVPVAAAATCDELVGEVDDVVCPATPEQFYAVGLWYEDFEQTTDEEVRALLERARRDGGPHDVDR
jgi:putative phosphoribosyl transferase